MSVTEQVGSGSRQAHRLRGLLEVCPIPNRRQRKLLRRVMEHDGDMNPRHHRIEQRALTRAQAKLAGIGLTLSDYSAAIQAFATNDIGTLHIIADRGDRALRDQKIKIESNSYTPERQALHEAIIDRVFAEKNPSESPVLLILGGVQGSGKSWEREAFFKEHPDAIFADPDEFRHQLLDGFDPTNNTHIQATHAESYYLADRIFERAAKEGYDLVYEGTLRVLDGQDDEIKARDAIEMCAKSDRNYKIRVTYVHAPLGECFRRSVRNRERGVPLHVLLDATGGFENFMLLTEDPRVETRIVNNTINGTSSHEVTSAEEMARLRMYYHQFYPHGEPLSRRVN